jgi:hypothetical protein
MRRSPIRTRPRQARSQHCSETWLERDQERRVASAGSTGIRGIRDGGSETRKPARPNEISSLAENGTPAQLTLIKDSFSALGIPCHAVVGNHDHQSDTDRSAYEQIFPEQINYAFPHRGWQIIGLDSSEGTKAKETRISATTLNWLDQNLSKLDPRRPTILFTHFPLGDSVWARPLNADDLLERCHGLNLQAVFCGHFHGFTERPFRHSIITTDKCCARVRSNHDGTPEKGWFVCQAVKGEIKRRFVEFCPNEQEALNAGMLDR